MPKITNHCSNIAENDCPTKNFDKKRKKCYNRHSNKKILCVWKYYLFFCL